MGRRKLTDEQEEEIARRYEAGESVGHLAAGYGVGRQVVRGALNRLGIVGRTTVNARPTPDALRRAYWAVGLPSIHQLGKRYGVSYKVVRRWLEVDGTKVRTTGEQRRINIRQGRSRPPAMDFTPDERRAFLVARGGPGEKFLEAGRRKSADHLAKINAKRNPSKTRLHLPCSWCGATVERLPWQVAKGASPACSKSHVCSFWRWTKRPFPVPRPLILQRLTERMAELRREGLPIGAWTLKKAGEPIGASPLEEAAYLATLDDREMSEYLDNQLDHQIREAGL